ncbi:MAG: hypothetical protein QOD93_1566 [Acetobacteraceae bacterium]|jgi:hypothetical protein|nr:hypothetical protein [Acetobacteraceae bacterium]
MTHIVGPDRSQTLLLPESPDEYGGQNNAVRFIDSFVDGLDLTAAGFIRAASKATGSRVKILAEKIATIRQRRTRCKTMLGQLDRAGEDQTSLTDPDSRAVAAHTGVAVDYNAEVAVDAKHKLIVERQVTTQVVDVGLPKIGVLVSLSTCKHRRASVPIRRRGSATACCQKSDTDPSRNE